ncbi:MAG: hypothetical protein LBE36_09790 [Flavobacteriaceae bacterium]|jgi:TRAP-type C4-dicarboxylate transport system substrate-binding protein|nr:hypothetical protein [Flavobacteriaceae bacterium]
MDIIVKLEETADVSFLKKLFSQTKGVKSVELSEEQEIFQKAIQKSREQFEKGEYKEYSEGLIKAIF